MIVLLEVEVYGGLASVRKVCLYHVGNFLSGRTFWDWHLELLRDHAIDWFRSLLSSLYLVLLINGNGLLAASSLLDGGGAQVYMNLVSRDHVRVDLPALKSSHLAHIFVIHIIGEMFRLCSGFIRLDFFFLILTDFFLLPYRIHCTFIFSILLLLYIIERSCLLHHNLRLSNIHGPIVWAHLRRNWHGLSLR